MARKKAKDEAADLEVVAPEVKTTGDAEVDKFVEQRSEVRKAFDIGSVIRTKVPGDVPVFTERSKEQALPRWIECPGFEVMIGSETDEERDFIFPISILSESYQDALLLLDFMIEAGKEAMEFNGIRISLHAVRHTVKRVIGKKLYKVELQYFFRMKKIPEIIKEV
jgi:hypothetical protein